MPKNMDWRDTYCSPETGNLRYPSSAKESVAGFAYVYTQDLKYARELAAFNAVEGWNNDRWVQFDGYSLGSREEPQAPPEVEGREEPADPNW